MPLGMGSMLPTGCCPPVLWGSKPSCKEKLSPPTLTFSELGLLLILLSLAHPDIL